MKDEIRINKNKFMNDVIRNRRGNVDLKYFSANKKPYNNLTSPNIEVNRINIRELSKLSDRPIQHKNEHNYNLFSYDKGNKSLEKKLYVNNMRNANNIINLNNINYNNYNTSSKRNIVIFTDPPKKLSDYILKEKSKSKKKVYKMIFIEENDFKNTKRSYVNTYLNSKNSYEMPKEEIKSHNYDIKPKYNNIYVNNSIDYNNNSNKKKFYVNMRRTYRMKERIPQIIKIQSFWRGFITRKIFVRNLKIISGSKIYKIIHKIIYGMRNNYIKIFLAKLQKIYNNSSQKKQFFDSKKLNKNNRIYVNKYPNKTNIKNSYNNYIYRRKNKSPVNSISFNKKQTNNIQVHNLKTISKKEINNNYDVFNESNYKKAIENEILVLIKYINKKAGLLHFPTLLYRLKILQKINLVEHRYNCLYNMIKIREKTKLYQYVQKYKNIIFSESFKIDKNNNKKNIKLIDTNINNSFDDKRVIKINTRKKYLQRKNSLNNSQKRISCLKNILNNLQTKNNKKLLRKYFYKWTNLIRKRIIIPNLKGKFEKSGIITKYNSTGLPKKKQIKIKKINSNYNSINSKMFVSPAKKKNFNSFYSENLNLKKMKVHKINVLVEPNSINDNKIKDLNLISKKDSSDNSYFITKVANISNKISNKINMYNYFKFWKKKSKEGNK